MTVTLKNPDLIIGNLIIVIAMQKTGSIVTLQLTFMQEVAM